MQKNFSMMNICVVEDELSLAEMIQLNLELEGYSVTHFSNGNEANEALQKSKFDLIILDVMLPEISGIDICKNIRLFSDVPVLFLSAKGTTSDRIEGLKVGANDYLPKPFDLEELLLRVAVLLNVKVLKEEEENVSIGNHIVDLKSYTVINQKNKEELALSKKEIELIRLFKDKEGQVISRTEILDKVWGKDQFPTSRTIDNYILHFRKIFEENPKEPVFFHSIRGVGYKFTSTSI